MPAYSKKFWQPEYHDHMIVEHDYSLVGTIRVKPATVLWKPKGAQKFYSVSLDQFMQWITGPQSGARRTRN